MRPYVLFAVLSLLLPVAAQAQSTQSADAVPRALSGGTILRPGEFGPIESGDTSFDSSYGGHSDPFRGGTWSNGKGGEGWAKTLFANPVTLRQVSIEMAGNEQSSDGSYIALQVLTTEDQWKTVYETAGVVINRDLFGHAPVRKIGPQTIDLPDIAVKGVRLYMKGPGAFSARNIQLIGSPID